MRIIGCDFHTRYQQIAMLDEATGELTERRLEHENGEAERFTRACQSQRGGHRGDGTDAVVRAPAGRIRA